MNAKRNDVWDTKYDHKQQKGSFMKLNSTILFVRRIALSSLLLAAALSHTSRMLAVPVQDVVQPADYIVGFGGISPAGEGAGYAVDDTTSKYVNLGSGPNVPLAPFLGPVGFVVVPSIGSTVVTGLRIYTADAFPESDPTDVTLEGSNDGGASYSLIYSNALQLPDGRNPAGLPLDPLNQYLQQIAFVNGNSYTSYRITFVHVKNALLATSLQVGEVELLGTLSSIVNAGQPTLNVSAETNGVLLSWSSSAATFSLESAGSLSGPVIWDPLDLVPQFAEGWFSVLIPVDSANRFFRLRQAAAPETGFNTTAAFNLGLENETHPSNGAEGSAEYNGGIGQVSAPDLDSLLSGLYPPHGQDTAAGSVFLATGELTRRAIDLVIPGRGFEFKMERKYRSGVTFAGPLGHNWDFNYNRRLVVANNGDVVRMDGYGRGDRYVWTANGFISPAGFYTKLTQQPDGTFLERDRHGSKVFYSATNSQGVASMTELRDRNGNRMQFQYDQFGHLSLVLDTLGRPIQYQYDSRTANLVQIRDFAGRIVRYQYDANGDLVSVISPAVTGTPNSNDFPNGKATIYHYSSGFADERLNHNLLSITAPNEVAANGAPSLVALYQDDTNSPDADRLLNLTIGGVNASGVPAGGTISYQYAALGPVGSNDFNSAVSQTTVTDRNGNQTEYQFNQLGSIVRIREFTKGLRAQEPAFYETSYRYNSDGQVLLKTMPLGNIFNYQFDSANPARYQQGNLLGRTELPDGIRPADQARIEFTKTYEPIYNRMRTFTSPRGNDSSYVPQNGGSNSPQRYTTTRVFDYQEGLDYADLGAELGLSPAQAQELLANIPMGLGDLNGDSETNQIQGNVIRIDSPTVTLLPGSSESGVEGSTNQPITRLYSYNQFGQRLTERDPEANVTQYSYYPENNPNGDGTNITAGVGSGPFGYLQQVVVDAMSDPARDSGLNPAPAQIQRFFSYDPVGNLTRRVDGRGIATDFAVNQLNQVVQITRAAAHNLHATVVPEPVSLTDFQYLVRTFYDYNNRVVRRQIEDRGNTLGTGGFVDAFYQNDILNHPLQSVSEVSTSSWVTNRYRYDSNGNLTMVVQPEGNAMTRRYDERNLLFQVVRGATNAQAGTLGAFTLAGSRAGSPSIYTLNYDQNRNVIETVDAADKDGSLANNSSIAGVGDATQYSYDGFDRIRSVRDAVGSQKLFTYDPAGNVVSATRRGAPGGPSPLDNSGSGNVDLTRTELSYDELGRPYELDHDLFIPAGVNTQRPVSITDGSLTPGDGKVTTRYEYDRNSRTSFVIDDDSNLARLVHDGANRLIRALDPQTNSVQWAYDGDGNVIETMTLDSSQVPGLSPESFLTTCFYDSLNRLQRRVNNIGESLDYRYDSRNNLVAATDGNGPVNGPTAGTIARRTFSAGTLTQNTVNGYGNVTLYTYDGLNRRIRMDRVLTASGMGDGANNGADVFGVKTSIPAPDPTQGGGDGLITILYHYDGNSLLVAETDDNGNQAQIDYDNHNRVVSLTKGVCTVSGASTVCTSPTSLHYQYDADGDLVQGIDPNGSTLANQFDAVGRLISRSIDRATNVVGTTEMTCQYDGLSRLVLATDNNEPLDASDDSTITYAYDSLDRVVEETQQLGSLPPKAISSSWSGVNRRTMVEYPNGRAITNAFDRLGRLLSVSDSDSATPIATFSYLGRSRVAGRANPSANLRLSYFQPNGLISAIDTGYDGLRRSTQLLYSSGPTNQLLIGCAYTYNRRNKPLTELKLHASSDSQLYRFDSFNRILQFSRGTLNSTHDGIVSPSSDAPSQSNWTLDGLSNWQQVDSETREYNSLNELIQRSNAAPQAIQWDQNQNQKDNGTFSFQFDYQNRLRKVSRKSDGQLVATYAYDARGRRISKVVTNSGALNGTTVYYLKGVRRIEERDSNDLVKRQYVYGRSALEPLIVDISTGPSAMAATAGATGPSPSTQRLFYLQNRVQSVYGLANASGQLVEGYQYDAYGQRTVFGPDAANGTVDFAPGTGMPGGNSSVGNDFGFLGSQYDPETGFDFSGSGYSDPSQGQFVNGPSGGMGGPGLGGDGGGFANPGHGSGGPSDGQSGDDGESPEGGGPSGGISGGGTGFGGFGDGLAGGTGLGGFGDGLGVGTGLGGSGGNGSNSNGPGSGFDGNGSGCGSGNSFTFGGNGLGISGNFGGGNGSGFSGLGGMGFNGPSSGGGGPGEGLGFNGPSLGGGGGGGDPASNPSASSDSGDNSSSGGSSNSGSTGGNGGDNNGNGGGDNNGNGGGDNNGNGGGDNNGNGGSGDNNGNGGGDNNGNGGSGDNSGSSAPIDPFSGQPIGSTADNTTICLGAVGLGSIGGPVGIAFGIGVCAGYSIGGFVLTHQPAPDDAGGSGGPRGVSEDVGPDSDTPAGPGGGVHAPHGGPGPVSSQAGDGPASPASLEGPSLNAAAMRILIYSGGCPGY